MLWPRAKDNRLRMPRRPNPTPIEKTPEPDPGTAPIPKERLHLARLRPPRGLVLDQDLHDLPRVQAGMRSRAFSGLLLSDQERRIRHFHRVLEGYVGR